jgi:hypothetical protein
VKFNKIEQPDIRFFLFLLRGTSGIDIDLRRVDIDQCPLPGNSTELNIFAASDKCKKATTKVSFTGTFLCKFVYVVNIVLSSILSN